MKRFVLTAVVALAVGFTSAGDAKAQIVYGYTVPSGNGFVNNRAMVAPGAYTMSSNFYSPWTGMMYRQAYTANILGQAYMRNYAYNPWTGMGFRTGFYQPNYYAFPYGGYGYGFYRRW